jgi:hypothetical protein
MFAPTEKVAAFESGVTPARNALEKPPIRAVEPPENARL